MLLLTRRAGETIVIGDNIRVLVQTINGNQVRIGVEAPRNMAVDREEIRVRKDADKRAGIA
jgi:carbon storage regulator